MFINFCFYRLFSIHKIYTKHKINLLKPILFFKITLKLKCKLIKKKVPTRWTLSTLISKKFNFFCIFEKKDDKGIKVWKIGDKILKKVQKSSGKKRLKSLENSQRNFSEKENI